MKYISIICILVYYLLNYSLFSESVVSTSGHRERPSLSIENGILYDGENIVDSDLIEEIGYSFFITNIPIYVNIDDQKNDLHTFFRSIYFIGYNVNNSNYLLSYDKLLGLFWVKINEISMLDSCINKSEEMIFLISHPYFKRNGPVVTWNNQGETFNVYDTIRSSGPRYYLRKLLQKKWLLFYFTGRDTGMYNITNFNKTVRQNFKDIPYLNLKGDNIIVGYKSYEGNEYYMELYSVQNTGIKKQQAIKFNDYISVRSHEIQWITNDSLILKLKMYKNEKNLIIRINIKDDKFVIDDALKKYFNLTTASN